MNDDSADFVAPPGISPNASATRIQRTMNAKADFMGAMGLETGDDRSLRAMQDITKVYETAGTSIRKSGAPFYRGHLAWAHYPPEEGAAAANLAGREPIRRMGLTSFSTQ